MPIDPLPPRTPKEPFQFIPRGEIVEIPEKNLRIYYVDQEQIEAFLQYYGIHPNGHSKEGLHPLSREELKKADLEKPKSKGRRRKSGRK